MRFATRSLPLAVLQTGFKKIPRFQRSRYHLPVRGQTLSNPEPFSFPFTESDRLMLALSSRLVDAMGGSFSYAQEQDWMIFKISVPKSPEDICASKTVWRH